MNKTTFYIVRHGESTANADPRNGFIAESHELGSDLTPLGIKQCEELEEKFEDIHFERAFSSDLRRAHKTAEILIRRRGLKVEDTQLLRERTRGKIVGEMEEQLAKLSGNIFDDMEQMSTAENEALKAKYGIELREDAERRIATFLIETAKKYPGETILAATHGAIVRGLLVQLGYADHKDLITGTIGNAAYVVVQVDGDTISIKETHGVRKRRGQDE